MPETNVTKFGDAPDGSDVQRAVLRNGGTTAAILTWGATLQDFRLDGVDRAFVLGGADFPPYLGPMRHFGAIAGPVANRIKDGRAVLNGRMLQLDLNENDRTMLHGGFDGLSLRNWTLDGCDGVSCALSIDAPDGQGGFPGNVKINAIYRLEDDGALALEITATTDQPTFFNPAHHSYWTLGPDLSDHTMTIHADTYLPVDDALIPLGAPAPVADTRFDFRSPRPVRRPGDALLDHNFCLSQSEYGLACRLSAEGYQLEIFTDAPGLQVYDGTGLDTGSARTLSGEPYGAYAGLALEPQFWPDAPNHPDYPDITLLPGQTARQFSRFHVTKV